ncbi:hypothetical protein GCM10010452_66320 [Crossiella cryophila]
MRARIRTCDGTGRRRPDVATGACERARLPGGGFARGRAVVAGMCRGIGRGAAVFAVAVRGVAGNGRCGQRTQRGRADTGPPKVPLAPNSRVVLMARGARVTRKEHRAVGGA